MKNTRDFNELLSKQLKDPAFAEAYINESLKEDDPSLLLHSLANVVKARGGMLQLHRQTGLSRGNLYKALSKKGRPELPTISRILNAIGFHLMVTAFPPKKHLRHRRHIYV